MSGWMDRWGLLIETVICGDIWWCGEVWPRVQIDWRRAIGDGWQGTSERRKIKRDEWANLRTISLLKGFHMKRAEIWQMWASLLRLKTQLLKSIPRGTMRSHWWPKLCPGINRELRCRYCGLETTGRWNASHSLQDFVLQGTEITIYILSFLLSSAYVIAHSHPHFALTSVLSNITFTPDRCGRRVSAVGSGTLCYAELLTDCRWRLASVGLIVWCLVHLLWLCSRSSDAFHPSQCIYLFMCLD